MDLSAAGHLCFVTSSKTPRNKNKKKNLHIRGLWSSLVFTGTLKLLIVVIDSVCEWSGWLEIDSNLKEMAGLTFLCRRLRKGVDWQGRFRIQWS